MANGDRDFLDRLGDFAKSPEGLRLIGGSLTGALASLTGDSFAEGAGSFGRGFDVARERRAREEERRQREFDRLLQRKITGLHAMSLAKVPQKAMNETAMQIAQMSGIEMSPEIVNVLSSREGGRLFALSHSTDPGVPKPTMEDLRAIGNMFGTDSDEFQKAQRRAQAIGAERAEALVPAGTPERARPSPGIMAEAAGLPFADARALIEDRIAFLMGLEKTVGAGRGGPIPATEALESLGVRFPDVPLESIRAVLVQDASGNTTENAIQNAAEVLSAGQPIGMEGVAVLEEDLGRPLPDLVRIAMAGQTTMEALATVGEYAQTRADLLPRNRFAGAVSFAEKMARDKGEIPTAAEVTAYREFLIDQESQVGIQISRLTTDAAVASETGNKKLAEELLKQAEIARQELQKMREPLTGFEQLTDSQAFYDAFVERQLEALEVQQRLGGR